MGEENRSGVAAPDRSSYDATADNGLTGLGQMNDLWTTAGRASTGAGVHDRHIEVRVVGEGLLLGPAPLTEGALVNEGEGTDFVSHIDIRC